MNESWILKAIVYVKTLLLSSWPRFWTTQRMRNTCFLSRRQQRFVLMSYLDEINHNFIKGLHFRELLCIYAFFIAQVTCLIRIAFILCAFFHTWIIWMLRSSIALWLIVHATSFKTLMWLLATKWNETRHFRVLI